MEHLLAMLLGRCLFRICRRWPVVFAGLAGVGQWVAISVIDRSYSQQNWPGVAAGGAGLIFCTGMLVLLVVKLRAGTWTAFCDWALSFCEEADASTASHPTSTPPKPKESTASRGRRFVLHCPHGYQPQLAAIVERLSRLGVVFLVVVGKDCARVEAAIEQLLVNPSPESKTLFVASLPGESLEQALQFARSFHGGSAENVSVIEL